MKMPFGGQRREGKSESEKMIGPEGVEDIVFNGEPGNLEVLSFIATLEGKKIKVEKGSEYSFRIRSSKDDPSDERIITGKVEFMDLATLVVGSPRDTRRELTFTISTPKGKYYLRIPGGKGSSSTGRDVIRSISEPGQKL